MRFETNPRGNITIVEPRVLYGVLAAVLVCGAALMAFWIRAEPNSEFGDWGWLRHVAAGLAVVAAAGLAWRAGFGRPLEFDPGHAALVRGSRVVLPFRAMDHIELRVVATENGGEYYRVYLRGTRGWPVDLGTYANDLDASTVAADIAAVIGKPVRIA